MILYIIFLIIESIYIYYVGKFGLKDSIDQPSGYLKAKNLLSYCKYGVVILIILISHFWLLIPIYIFYDYLESRILFSFSKKRAIKNMIKILTGDGKTEKELGTKPMEIEDARRVAPEMVEQNIKSGSYII